MLDFSALPDVSEAHPELDASERWYAAHMKAREDAYEAIFGKSVPDGKICSPVDPNLTLNWPGGGLYKYPPQKQRASWYYVTHGLTQPFEESELGGEHSGWGIELVFSTPTESEWPIGVLLNLVKYLLFQKNSRVILPGDRIPCNGPLDLTTETKLTHIIATICPDYESEILLPAGQCQLVHLIGVTTAEHDAAQSYGTGTGGTLILERVLNTLGVGHATDLKRGCVTENADFEVHWRSAQSSLEAMWAEKSES